MSDAGAAAEPVIDPAEAERMVEALLFAAAEPLSAADLARRLPEGADVGRAIASLRRQLPDFAPEKIAQLAALQQRYQEQRSEIFSQVRTGGMLPEEREKVAAIDKAMHAELAQLLTPAELVDYDLRLSNTASQLRYSLSAFNATEAEFRAIFKLQSAFDQQFGTSYQGQTPEEMRARSEAQAQLRRDIEAALGADRFADYERAQDYNYRQSTELVARLQLPPQTANTLFALQLDTQQRATALRREMGANPAASAAQLTTLAAEAEAKITALLGGARGLEAYKQYGGSWLVNLAPRTTTVPGVIKVQPPPPPSR